MAPEDKNTDANEVKAFNAAPRIYKQAWRKLRFSLIPQGFKSIHERGWGFQRGSEGLNIGTTERSGFNEASEVLKTDMQEYRHERK